MPVRYCLGLWAEDSVQSSCHLSTHDQEVKLNLLADKLVCGVILSRFEMPLGHGLKWLLIAAMPSSPAILKSIFLGSASHCWLRLGKSLTKSLGRCRCEYFVVDPGAYKEVAVRLARLFYALDDS
jgi:hypothetical protein